MTILALDASTKSTGYAIFSDTELKDYGCITNSSTILMKRIEYMVQEIDKILSNNTDIKKIVMEEVRPEDKSGYSNLKTYKALMYLQGCIQMLLYQKHSKVEIEFVYPSEWRSRCGIHTGRGVKRDVLKAASIDFVKKTYGLEVNDDIADAIGIGYSNHSTKEIILC